MSLFPLPVAALPRLPNGRINNCAIDSNADENSCQMCGGKCPDKFLFEMAAKTAKITFGGENGAVAVVGVAGGMSIAVDAEDVEIQPTEKANGAYASPQALPPSNGLFGNPSTVLTRAITTKSSFEWTEEQLVALEAIDDWAQSGSPFFALTGPAGSGKSTLIREVVERYPHATLSAMTGKAALRLSDCAGRGATTLHKILYYPPHPGEDLRFTRLREPPSSALIVDESSMMSPAIFNDLQSWARQGVKILFVGDSYQLPPVIVGKEARDFGEDYSVFSQVGGFELSTVMRSVGGVLRAATKIRETGELCEQSDLDESGLGYEFERHLNPTDRAIDEYLADRDDHLLITWKNSTRMTANQKIRERLGHGGPLPDEGEPVLIKRNSATMGLLNGEIVECGGFEDGPKVGSVNTLWMRVRGDLFERKLLVSIEGGDPKKGGELFDGQMPWIEDWKKYHIDLKTKLLSEPVPITWAYCLTAHSGQGGEARRVTVFLNRGDEYNKNFRKMTTLPDGTRVPFSARFLYTALTRGKTRAAMIAGV